MKAEADNTGLKRNGRTISFTFSRMRGVQRTNCTGSSLLLCKGCAGIFEKDSFRPIADYTCGSAPPGERAFRGRKRRLRPRRGDASRRTETRLKTQHLNEMDEASLLFSTRSLSLRRTNCGS